MCKDELTVVRVNAWEDDYCGDPLVAIVSALIEAFDEKSPAGKKIKSAALTVCAGLWSFTNQGARKLTGLDAKEVMSDLETAKAIDADIKPDFYGDVTNAYVVYPWEIDRGLRGMGFAEGQPEI